ncbi:MAG TPA: hypothetical protein VL588_09270 [Bdellovibrionota bacterium]|nr:hypothetical protein [Bdellovibrionota bacterium]
MIKNQAQTILALSALLTLTGCMGLDGLDKRQDAKRAGNGLNIEFVGGGADGSGASGDLSGAERSLSTQITPSVAHFRQLVDSLTTAGGVPVDATTLALLQENRTILALTGNPEEITAPMWMAITQLAGSVCSQVVRVEESLDTQDRRFFKAIMFGDAAAQVSSGQIEDAIRRLARGFFGRNESTEERDRLVSLFENVSQGETDVRKGLLAVCTAVAGSVSAQTM